LSKFLARDELNELEKQGLIQTFEYTYELAWNTIKDFLTDQGENEIFGSRDAFRLAFERGLIDNGDTWMEMIKSRTLTSHTYNEEIAEEIAQAVIHSYYNEFVDLEKKFTHIAQNHNGA
jgi:nucleotidyltransferase substrate binding protein (TIGR01987 family)